jgi:hypothetical protein
VRLAGRGRCWLSSGVEPPLAPFFERAAPDRVAKAFGLRYVEPCDAYLDETDAYAGMQRDSLHLYAIGAQAWTWFEAEDLERDS